MMFITYQCVTCFISSFIQQQDTTKLTNFSISSFSLQRQDTDERLRKIQSEKEALAVQVQVLTDQLQSQGSKIAEMDRILQEKNQLLSNAEDLLQRVSVFATTVGIHIDKQKVPRFLFFASFY